MIGLTLGEFARLTLLGAGLGTVPLASIIAVHHALAWKRGEKYDAPILLMARLGTLLIVFPITWLLFRTTEVDPYNWMTIMYGLGVVLVCAAYLVIARRWNRPRPDGDKERRRET